MHINRIVIKNFRCIRNLDVVLSPTWVLIGENNAGKSALLDAVTIALGRKWGRSGRTGFTEYDFPFRGESGEPWPEILIKLWLAESQKDEWPQSLVDDLYDIVNTDPRTGLNSICLQVTCTFESVAKEVEPVWQFLTADNVPFSGSGARVQNTSRFFEYVPCFSMSAMRDASVEFGSRSRFWGSLLKSIEVDPDVAENLEQRFEALNTELLRVDPKLEAIKGTLRDISEVIANGAAGNVDVRAIPVNLWEIISKSELVIQGQAQDPWLPIGRHGHGVQSLAVIFLFRAFVENALAASFREETEPVLTLEEPEAHLHPQACRSLWNSIKNLPGQKLVTTHSPFFVQNVPFRDIVLLRRGPEGPRASAIPRFVVAHVPLNDDVQAEIAKAPDALRWDASLGAIVCSRTLDEQELRGLLRCYVDQDRHSIHAALREMREASRRLIRDDDVSKLESWAKRIRGEILFASKWLLCEGQAEYAILGAVAEVLGCPLDAHGIAVIDYQNNGSPGAFAALARALDFPWSMLCDGDQGGDDHIAQLVSRNFTATEIDARVVQLPSGMDLERLIVNSALRPCMLVAVRELSPTTPEDDGALLTFAGDNKEIVAVRIAAQIRLTAQPDDIPSQFRQIFVRIEACL